MNLSDAAASLMKALPMFAQHLGIALATLVLAVAIYAMATPTAQLRLARDGNVAAALWLVGTILAMALPIASAMRYSTNAAEVVVWSALAAAIQIVTYFVAAAIAGKTRETLEQGKIAPALLVVGIQLGVAIVNAAALSP